MLTPILQENPSAPYKKNVRTQRFHNSSKEVIVSIRPDSHQHGPVVKKCLKRNPDYEMIEKIYSSTSPLLYAVNIA